MFWAITFLLFAAEPPPAAPPAAPPAEDTLARRIDEIDALASGEPPILGIPSYLWAAEVMTKHRPKDARRFVDQALSRTIGLRDENTRSMLLTEAAEALVPFDREAAAGHCANLPRSYRAHCFDHLLARLDSGNWTASTDLARRALSAGAFAIPNLRGLLESASKNHPDDYPHFLTEILAAFPNEASPREVEFLLQLLRHNPTAPASLRNQCLDKAHDSAKAKSFTKDRKDARESALADIVSTARKVAPDWLPLNWDQLKRYAPKDEPPPESPKNEKTKEEAESEALGQRFEKLIEEADAEATPAPQKRARVLDAWELTFKLKGDDRLIAQSMSTRRMWDLGLKEQAGRAAGELQKSFEDICRCQDVTCDSLDGREECAERVKDFAEYLKESKLEPGDLGLRHPSLRVRILILELEESFGVKRKGLFGFLGQ